MIVRLQQLNPTIGDLEGNGKRIELALQQAARDKVDLLVLPELAVTGYPPQDLLESASFREQCYAMTDRLVKATGTLGSGTSSTNAAHTNHPTSPNHPNHPTYPTHPTALLFGNITRHDGPGRPIYNSAILAQQGKILGITHKTLLPTYDIFDDLRYFEPNTTFACLTFNGWSLGVTICEDIWINENEIQYHTYAIDPVTELLRKGADLILNISASPFTKTKHESRFRMLQAHAERCGVPVLYCNQTGTQTDIVYDGDSMAFNGDGRLIAGASSFCEDFIDLGVMRDATGQGCELTGMRGEDMRGEASLQTSHHGSTYPATNHSVSNHPVTNHPLSNHPATTYPDPQERLCKAICSGIRDYFQKTGAGKGAVLGLSGGIDSALVAVLAAEALGSDRVTGLLMPSEFSSEGSILDAEELALRLGIQTYQLPIGDLYQTALQALAPVFGDLPFNTAEENLQSRIRGSLLMAYANKHGDLLLATGNKSEYAVGYSTLYGDMNGALAPIGDLWKTEVYALSRWFNEKYFGREVIPVATIEKAPSAELRPDQKDSDSLPPYDQLDAILKLAIEDQLGEAQIAKAGVAPADVVHRILQMVDRNEFKRFQAAPILKMSVKAFGTGRRRPIVQGWSGS
ncbi:MAG: NAD+ synthase [Bacteroidetes bacterium]|nr:MAG: NAD+ synthase [Bacteroidota bacterium]